MEERIEVLYWIGRKKMQRRKHTRKTMSRATEGVGEKILKRR